MNRIITYTLKNEHANLRLSEFLKLMHYPASALTRLRKRTGLIKIDGNPVHMSYVIKESDKLAEVIIEEYEMPGEAAAPGSLCILYEDEDVLIVNKEAGMPIHQSAGNHENTLASIVLWHWEKQGEERPFRCITRLDKYTSGLVLIAKNYLAAGILGEEMQQGLIGKEYYAIVENGNSLNGHGTINLPIGRKNGSVILREIQENGALAITHYEKADAEPAFLAEYIRQNGLDKGLSLENTALVKIITETGRTHQIRVHMAAIGHPLAGDFLYNPQVLKNEKGAHHILIAYRLSFYHPVTYKKMEIDISLC